MLARRKLNSIEIKISETLMNNEIDHEDFLTIINEERNYRELKGSIRTIEEVIPKKLISLKKIKKVIDEVTKRNKIFNNSLKTRIKNLFFKVQKNYGKHKSKSFKN